MTTHAIRPGTVFAGTLPASTKPWRFTVLADPPRIIATNPDHEPLYIEQQGPNFVIVAVRERSPWSTS